MNYVSGNGFLFIAKYDSSGNYQYAKGYGGNGNEGGRDLAFDSNGNLTVVVLDPALVPIQLILEMETYRVTVHPIFYY